MGDDLAVYILNLTVNDIEQQTSQMSTTKQEDVSLEREAHHFPSANYTPQES